MRIVMGVDGGGTKTHAVIVDESGKTLGAGISGCANYQINGIEAALGSIDMSMRMALDEAGLCAEDIDFVQYGLSGADRESDFAILNRALSSLPYAAWDVVCDTMEGLRAGAGDYAGVVLVCGTGTNAAGRSSMGKAIQTGGFGYLFGDGAGADCMAVETFRAAIRSWELREIPSRLTALVPGFFGYASMEETVTALLDQDATEIPNELTVVLHEAAAEGDELAILLLQRAGRELGLAAGSVVRRLGGLPELSVLPIVLVGSIVQKGRSPYLLEALKEAFSELTGRQENAYKLVIPEMVPVFGAVLLAMDQLGIKVTEEMEQAFISGGGEYV
ncbi:N-acetylglucosamine kinase [Paenibacillus eucommiae]|uniref:N-acetylglucosamine kinase-like BadF-type ATPase n=1 Tax=Paenibacillus eucommiae TaxID=1355755 RepID=A0ABS4IML4_9BACL|nr:BadF/BadG/BcrA/BcrD ATPase family protein [Paenibacillus eucommiae]MBP1988803.1 N-acetylglucosamine kinase-like BadF-type ATPase [Paenibacillus eucommiae]